MKELIKKCEELGFVLTVSEEGLTAMAVKMKSKSRFPKPEFNYRFRTKERMVEFITEFIEKKLEVLKWKEEKKEAKKKAREEMKHSFEVGQVLYDSWGWEQTNIDFYQVIEVKPKSVIVNRISSNYAKNQESGYSSMSAFVVPNKNSFIGEPQRKPILVSVHNNIPSYYIKSKHGWISEYTDGERGVYSSWYA